MMFTHFLTDIGKQSEGIFRFQDETLCVVARDFLHFGSGQIY